MGFRVSGLGFRGWQMGSLGQGLSGFSWVQVSGFWGLKG